MINHIMILAKILKLIWCVVGPDSEGISIRSCGTLSCEKANERWLTLRFFKALKAASVVLAVFISGNFAHGQEISRPNIVLFLVDDLGYGDVGCYGGTGVGTPNIDSLASSGLMFTDAHCSAATCTPSRYSLLTGEHAFREAAKVLDGDATLIIEPGSWTLPAMLKRSGYTTAVVGKWHLGLGDQDSGVDWNHEVEPGPMEVGFDYSFILPSTGDRVPCVLVEGHRVVGLEPDDPIRVDYNGRIENMPDGLNNPDLIQYDADCQHSGTIINGVSRIGFMDGGTNAHWVDEELPFLFNEKSEAFIEENKDRPFFLFYSFHDIHVPRIIHPKFVGSSSMGPRGDAIAQVDWCVGEVVNMLEERGLRETTLIIFTSDNGPVLNDGYEDQAIEKLGRHSPSGEFRGGKYSLYEAGTKVPTILNWPGEIDAVKSGALLSQMDFYASFASYLNQEIEAGAAIDSLDFMDSWMGRSEIGRTELILEGYGLALRRGKWKYIKPVERDEYYDWVKKDKGIEHGRMQVPQLFDLESSSREEVNVASQFPEIVEAMERRLNGIVDDTQGYRYKQ